MLFDILLLGGLLLVDHDRVLVDGHRDVADQFVQLGDLLALRLGWALVQSLALRKLRACSHKLAW